MSFKSISEVIKKSKTEPKISNSSLFSDSSVFLPNASYLHSLNISHILNTYDNWTLQYSAEIENLYESRNVIIVLILIAITCISLFGNTILCQIVFTPNFRSTTNLFVGNLSISDLLMTIFNIPMQIIKIIYHDWLLGPILCKSLSFVQSLSVTTSSVTIACIAVDRYFLIVYPLKARAELNMILIRICFIWIFAIVVSLPYVLLANVQEVTTLRKLVRCQVVYPHPAKHFRKVFTLLSFFVQFIIPLMISTVAYIRVCGLIWNRKAIGLVSYEQILSLRCAKKRTIKFLVYVLVVFAACWLPLNIYHVYQDLQEIDYVEKHKSNVFLICHMIAMSSVCYNPFIYFWLNENFRKKVKSNLKWIWSVRNLQLHWRFPVSVSKKIKQHSSIDRNSSGMTSCSVPSRELKLSEISSEMQHLSDNEEEKKINSSTKCTIKFESDLSKAIQCFRERSSKRSIEEENFIINQTKTLSSDVTETSV